MGLSLKSVAKSVTKPFKAVFESRVKTVKSLVRGDLVGTAGHFVNAVSLGTIDLLSANMGETTGDNATSGAIGQLETASEESKKRRRALYATKGQALGEEVESVGDTFGNNRGTLFGN